MYKKSIMSKRIFNIEKEVNIAVLAENWVYFDWFKDVEYKIKDGKFYGVKIKLTFDTFHPVSVYLDTEEKSFKAYYENREISYNASNYMCEKINQLYSKKYCINRGEN